MLVELSNSSPSIRLQWNKSIISGSNSWLQVAVHLRTGGKREPLSLYFRFYFLNRIKSNALKLYISITDLPGKSHVTFGCCLANLLEVVQNGEQLAPLRRPIPSKRNKLKKLAYSVSAILCHVWTLITAMIIRIQRWIFFWQHRIGLVLGHCSISWRFIQWKWAWDLFKVSEKWVSIVHTPSLNDCYNHSKHNLVIKLIESIE